jgi:hypothetical protein
MNLLNWMTWSSKTCKELKRLCIWITKKRVSKLKKHSSISQYSSFSESFNSEVFMRLTLSSIITILSEMKNSTFQSTDSFATYISSDQYRQSYQASSQTIQNWQRKIAQTSQQSLSSIMFETFFSSQLQQFNQQSSAQFMIQSSQSFVIQSMIDAENVLNVKIEDSNIKFLRNLKEMKRAFRIKCTVTLFFEEFMKLSKFTVQTNQESNMNIMIESLKHQFNLSKNKLTNIEFHELFIKTANHRNTYLEFWIECFIVVEDIVRVMRCFISSSISITSSFVSNHHNLFLRLSSLFSVNAVLTIRKFKITIKNSIIEKISRDVIESETMFCREHTLLMYSRKAFNSEKFENFFEFESESSNYSFKNELSDIKIILNDVLKRF